MIHSDFKDCKIIIFDLGNVIIDLRWDKWISAFSQYKNLGDKELLGSITRDPSFIDFEIGKISEVQMCGALNELLESNMTQGEFTEKWNSLLGDIPFRKLELITQLRNEFKVLILSNTNHTHEIAFNQLVGDLTGGKKLDHLVDKAYYSHVMGLRKPNRDIYETVLSDQDANPNEVVFFDDNVDNITSANQLGINGVLVKSPDKLWDYFER